MSGESVRIEFKGDAIHNLQYDPGTGRLMRAVAEIVSRRVKVPEGQQLSVKAGVARRGAFSQVIMRGKNAVFVEFGTRTRKAVAPLRNAIFSTKGVKVGR